VFLRITGAFSASVCECFTTKYAKVEGDDQLSNDIYVA